MLETAEIGAAFRMNWKVQWKGRCPNTRMCFITAFVGRNRRRADRCLYRGVRISEMYICLALSHTSWLVPSRFTEVTVHVVQSTFYMTSVFRLHLHHRLHQYRHYYGHQETRYYNTIIFRRVLKVVAKSACERCHVCPACPHLISGTSKPDGFS